VNQTREKILSVLEINDSVLSRTQSTGLVDSSVSDSKRSNVPSAELMLELVARNRSLVCLYISGITPAMIADKNDLLAAAITVASITNLGIAEGSLFRTWELPGSRRYDQTGYLVGVPPADIWDRLESMTEVVCSFIPTSPVLAAAIIEWEVGIGPLHPFCDACGRISRAMSLLILNAFSLPARLHSTRDEYFRVGTQGRDKFIEYFQGLPQIELN
jgi:hypothetical protein